VRSTLKRHFGRYLHEPKELLWNPLYVRKETALLSPEPPDVLLVRDHSLTASCVRVSRRIRRPLVIEVNAPAAEAGLFLEEYFHLPFIDERLERYKLHAAHAITVVSGALKDFLIERHRLSPEKVHVVPNGADLERFDPQTPADPTLPAGFAEGPTVGFVGSFEVWHGSGLLAQMAHRVGTRRPETRFLFVGDGPEAPNLRRATESLGERVHFTGRVEHQRVPGLVAAFDVGVVAAAGFYMCPLKLIEWMAMDRAVVAPRQGPLEELIEDGKEGLLFEPNNPEALTQAVLRLVDDPELRQRLGRTAGERARGSLSWTHNARRVLDACQEARERHSRAERS
jgi:glycosyltransferase involved in cell wall biosynthesis